MHDKDLIDRLYGALKPNLQNMVELGTDADTTKVSQTIGQAVDVVGSILHEGGLAQANMRIRQIRRLLAVQGMGTGYLRDRFKKRKQDKVSVNDLVNTKSAAERAKNGKLNPWNTKLKERFLNGTDAEKAEAVVAHMLMEGVVDNNDEMQIPEILDLDQSRIASAHNVLHGMTIAVSMITDLWTCGSPEQAMIEHIKHIEQAFLKAMAEPECGQKRKRDESVGPIDLQRVQQNLESSASLTGFMTQASNFKNPVTDLVFRRLCKRFVAVMLSGDTNDFLEGDQATNDIFTQAKEIAGLLVKHATILNSVLNLTVKVHAPTLNELIKELFHGDVASSVGAPSEGPAASSEDERPAKRAL